MDYYAYEYSVLLRLQDIFLIKCININTDSNQATQKIKDEFGNYVDKVIANFTLKDEILLDFNNDFSYIISRGKLREKFAGGIKLEEVVMVLEGCIKELYMSKICK